MAWNQWPAWRGIRKLRQANEILGKASRILARQSSTAGPNMSTFIDDHRAAYGLGPICRVLPIAPSTHYRHVGERQHPDQRSARAKRDEDLSLAIQRIWAEHFQVYGGRKVWR